MHDTDQIAEFFDSFLQFKRTYKNGEERYYVCPECNRVKLAVNLKKLKAHCWHDSLNYNDLKFLVLKYAPDKLAEYNKIIGTHRVSGSIEDAFYEEALVKYPDRLKLPEGFKLIQGKTELELSAYKYLTERGIRSDVIASRYIGVCNEGKYKDAIIFPSFGIRGYVDFFVARWFLNRDYYLYESVEKSNIIFNELFVDWHKPVVLVEGVFDAYCISDLHMTNVIPLMGSSLSTEYRLVYNLAKYGNNVVVALDNDAKNKEKRIVTMLRNCGIKTSAYDIGRLNVKDPAVLRMKFWDYLPKEHKDSTDISILEERIREL